MLYDINLRFTYRTPWRGRVGRLVLDLLHVGSPRRTVWVDQWRFRGIDDEGNQINENANFGTPLAHQPPMTVRFGVEVGL